MTQLPLDLLGVVLRLPRPIGPPAESVLTDRGEQLMLFDLGDAATYENAA